MTTREEPTLKVGDEVTITHKALMCSLFVAGRMNALIGTQGKVTAVCSDNFELDGCVDHYHVRVGLWNFASTGVTMSNKSCICAHSFLSSGKGCTCGAIVPYRKPR